MTNSQCYCDERGVMKFFGSKNNDKATEHILRGNTYAVQHLKYYEALRRHLYAESSVAEAAGSMKSVKNG